MQKKKNYNLSIHFSQDIKYIAKFFFTYSSELFPTQVFAMVHGGGKGLVCSQHYIIFAFRRVEVSNQTQRCGNERQRGICLKNLMEQDIIPFQVWE